MGYRAAMGYNSGIEICRAEMTDIKNTEQTLTKVEQSVDEDGPIEFDVMEMYKREVALTPFPEPLKAQIRQVSRATANALYTESKDAAIRQIARDVASRRVALNQAESLLASYREKARKSTAFDMKKLDYASRDVDREHRRYLAAIDALDRLTRPENPVLNISKGQTYIHIAKEDEQ